MLPAAHLTLDQSSILEHSDVASHAREGHRERPGEVCDSGVTGAESDKQCSPRGVSERRVGAVEELIFKQLVDYIRSN